MLHAIARTALPDPTEDAIHRAVVQMLRLAYPRLIHFHPANGGARSKATAGKLKAMGVVPGVPDIALVLPTGRAAFIELKRRTGRQSPEQRSFQSRVEAAGALYAVCRSSEDVQATLDGWLAEERKQ